MNALEKIKSRAQSNANRVGHPMAILNLNRVGSALYVVREMDPTIEECREFICRIEPDPAVSCQNCGASVQTGFCETRGKFLCENCSYCEESGQ